MRLLNAFLKTQSRQLASGLIFKRSSSSINFDGSQEILENRIDNFLLIGINLPDSKNLLTENALDQLINSLKRFYNNNEIRVGILHGIGGNFCSGIVSSENALRKSSKIIEELNKGEKPIIAALNGHIIDFGFQLSVMCDLKVIEKNSIIHAASENQSTEIPAVVCQRLAMTTGLSKAMQILLCREKINFSAFNITFSGFFNKEVETGCALGQALVWAQKAALMPLKSITEYKSKVYSILSESTSKELNNRQAL